MNLTLVLSIALGFMIGSITMTAIAFIFYKPILKYVTKLSIKIGQEIADEE